VPGHSKSRKRSQGNLYHKARHLAGRWVKKTDHIQCHSLENRNQDRLTAGISLHIRQAAATTVASHSPRWHQVSDTWQAGYLSLSLSLSLSLCVCVCVSVCLSVCLSLSMSVCLSVCLSVSLSLSLTHTHTHTQAQMTRSHMYMYTLTTLPEERVHTCRFHFILTVTLWLVKKVVQMYVCPSQDKPSHTGRKTAGHAHPPKPPIPHTRPTLLLCPTRDSCQQLWIIRTDVTAHGSLTTPKDPETVFHVNNVHVCCQRDLRSPSFLNACTHSMDGSPVWETINSSRKLLIKPTGKSHKLYIFLN
jgi:hypothetical protein